MEKYVKKFKEANHFINPKALDMLFEDFTFWLNSSSKKPEDYGKEVADIMRSLIKESLKNNEDKTISTKFVHGIKNHL